MIKNILATFLGFIAASIIVYVFETLIGHTLFPLPQEANPTNMDWLKSHMNKIPLGAKAFVVFGHFMGIIVGMYIAGLISKTSMIPAYIVAGILILATAFVTFALPKGLWFIIAEVVAVIAGFSFGKTLAQKNVYN